MAIQAGNAGVLLLAKLRMNTKAGLFVLDEPTNHLDLPSMEVLEEALRSFPGGVLLISHDRRLGYQYHGCQRFHRRADAVCQDWVEHLRG